MSIFFDINWLAVIFATVASVLVSYLWYGPIFGKRWAAAMGLKPAETGSPNTVANTQEPVHTDNPDTNTQEPVHTNTPSTHTNTQKPGSSGPLNANNTKIAMIGLALLQCFLISSLIDYYKGDLGSVILWAIVIWLGIVAPLLKSQWLFEKRRLDMTLLCAGHQLVSLLVVSFILGVWY